MFCAVAMVGVIISVLFERSISAEPLQQDFFDKYVESNDRFGTKIFRDLLADNPDKNLIFSPFGISSLFACLREGTTGTIRNELDRAFEWAPDQELVWSHKLLAARFIFPPVSSQNETVRREEFWLKNSLQFHGSAVQKSFSARFLEKAKNDFGLEFDEVTDAKEWDSTISRFPIIRPLLDLGASEQNILVLTSVVNLMTEWRRPWITGFSGEFLTAKGIRVPAFMLVSDHRIFPYAKTESYEAVVLPAENADFIVVMPNEGVNLKTLAEEFAEKPDFLVAQLERRSGEVELPQFSFVGKEDFRSRLENLGAKTVFNDLGDLVKIPGSRLLAVEQIVSCLVDLRGIQTKAWTHIVGLLGGRPQYDEGFQMKINRPFLFQIRDNRTGILLFMGAVTDPSIH
jgi:serine protease inhibitor